MKRREKETATSRWSRLVFDGDEKNYELRETKLLGHLYLQGLKETILSESFEEDEEDTAKNAEAYAELIQFLDDKSLSLVMREAADDGRAALKILQEYYAGKGKPRVISLYTELTSLQKSPSECVTDYVIRAETAITALRNAGFLTLDNFNVTCDEQNICAVRGTLMSVNCDHSNINIKTGFWFSQKQRTNWRNKDEPEDLTLDSDYSGRIGQWITEDYSRLSIDDLRERDSGEYQLMFIMKDGVKHLSSVTVNLTVSVLQVKMNPESTGQRVKLSCDSSCPLTSEYNYLWYKNGQYLTNNQSIFVSSSENTDSYYCTKYKMEPSSSVCETNCVCN
nr:uncharacterized protein LOC129453068 [Misgurnus anguillicaudatus]